MKNTKKLNEGCLKIFQLLKLLYEDEAEYNDVTEIFLDEEYDQTPNNLQVNLNKYINTLKIFGIKVKKERNKFKLLSGLYSMDFTLEDLKSISLIISYLNNIPDADMTKNIEDFLHLLEIRMNNEDRKTLSTMNSNPDYDFSFYYSDIREQIEQCEQICKDNFFIVVIYKKNGKELQCKCTAKEVIYNSKTAYLKVYDASIRQNLEIPIENILAINSLPQKATSIEMSTTIVYKLKNRLAKTYKLKEYEHTNGCDEKGNLIVVTKSEDFDKLISRLMRYAGNCEVVSPKPFREKMQAVINETLANYESE